MATEDDRNTCVAYVIPERRLKGSPGDVAADLDQIIVGLVALRRDLQDRRARRVGTFADAIRRLVGVNDGA